MRANDKPGRDRLAVGVLLLAGLILCAGCSKFYIEGSIERPAGMERPAWVGVYYLSKEKALDRHDNTEIMNTRWQPDVAEVIDHEVYSVSPGTVELFTADNPEIRWVLVVAGFPNADEYARETVPVKDGAQLSITVIVEEASIDLTWSD